MLKSELHKLEKVIGAVTQSADIPDKSSNPVNYAEWVRSVSAACERLKDSWTHELFSSVKEQSVFRFIQYHQAGITQLSNALRRKLPAAKLPAELSDSNIVEFYNQALGELERLLQFLKNNCYRYFDLDYPVSIFNCRRQYDSIADFMQELSAYPNNAIEKALVDVIANSVQEQLVKTLQSGISYRHADHILNLLRMVHQMIHAIDGTTTETLAQALYKQNLNTLHFSNWYQEHILQYLGENSAHSDTNSFIDKQIKILSTTFVDTEKAFEPELPSIDQVLLPWLQEKTGKFVKGKKPAKNNGNGQMPLNLSVPQFAMFVRIFYKNGCFPDPNIARLTRFFAGHFTTKKQLHISIKSFARAFYSLDQSAAAIVREYLQKMLDYLNKTYFP